jgi:hypothetical protein
MNKHPACSLLFSVAALYDGLLGLAFLIAPGAVFEAAGIQPPNHPGYVQFPAALLVTFAMMFAAIAAHPARNRNLIPYGILLKVSYCGVVFYHWAATGLPWIWKPFALADVAFLGLFAAAWMALADRPATDSLR